MPVEIELEANEPEVGFVTWRSVFCVPSINCSPIVTRARASRLITVPIGTSSTSAASRLDAEDLVKMAATGITDLDLTGQLELAGQTKPVNAKLRVSRLGADKLMVLTRTPILINSNDFGLRAGVEALREVMGLNFISASAPVTFALVLDSQK
jgi:hypothetical protein